ncbi:MAG: M3 family oligoendopeptidase [Candidatus Eisenbacteria bacterium]|nr:M3 family oligoendopeptidase [Candidatus Eisenbacteria bacterium]
MPETQVKLPHWDLSNVYSGLDADDFDKGLAKLDRQLKELEALIEQNGVGRLDKPPEDTPATAATLSSLIELLNAMLLHYGTLSAYVQSFVTTDSYNKLAARRASELEQIGVRVDRIYVRFEAWVGSLAPALDAVCKLSPVADKHRLALADIVDESKFRMETALEDLASELLLSGAGLMHKLQGTVTSQLKASFERDGKTEKLPMTVMRNLANDPDEDIRKRAYETELSAWESVKEPVAFALNCVKGAAITLSRRRGYEGVLHASLERNKMDKPTLNALLESMKASFPMFRRYFKSKARKLGNGSLPWWDLFAPVGKVELEYTWEEASNYIVEQFGTFSGELADFARNAFEKRWIDAEPRDGKRGGAFCMGVRAVEESRILANFDGSFDQLGTLAHELGHGFHNYCQKGLPSLRRGSPMTLAETASIFCQTIVFNAALKAAPADAQVAILENQLMDASQVIVDIYSRFLFESEVVKRREQAELSADEFCDLMLDAQRQTYADGLDEEHLHPYMWLLKPHYYLESYNFYNFPYAFGLLFGLGVYATYLKEGDDFIPRYKELLRSTGEGKAADLAGRFGIDIHSRDFWDASLAVLAKQVDRYCEFDG